MKRAVLYLRVSTIEQTTSNQERELRQAAERAGWEVTKVYRDHGISGAKSRDKRPAFDALCRDATKRQFDVVMAWSVDRLGRSLQDLVTFLSELHALKVDLFLHQQGLDTTTPAGKAMFQMLGVFAEFERSIIQERVRAGLARAKDEGKVAWTAQDSRRYRNSRQGHAGERHRHDEGREDARSRRWHRGAHLPSNSVTATIGSHGMTRGAPFPRLGPA